MRIDEVMAGAGGDATIQFVELKMNSPGQTFVSGHQIWFFDAGGVQTGTFTFTGNVSNGNTNDSILVGTVAFEAVATVVPDFTMAADVMAPDGRVCFETIDCVAYGNYVGDNTGYGTPAAALPITGVQSLIRILTGTPDNSTDYALGTPAPRNNAGTEGEVIIGGPATYTVNLNNDIDDGTCDVTHCSLREAINAANANAGQTDTIAFNIPGVGPHTFIPDAPLPTITDPVIIDGTMEPDFAGTPVIELNGINAGLNANGLHITAGGSTVRGLVINRFGGNGISIDTNGGNFIQGNYIGTDVAGTADLGNGGSGVALEGSTSNTIGGTEPGAANLLSGNDGAGVALFSGATGNQVLGNLIGTDVNGITALDNKHGIEIHSSNNTIGGTVAGAGNVISGNILYGVYIISPDSTANVFQGNFIGTDITGTVALGNGDDGLRIQNAPSNIIGGTVAGARNVISGNGAGGIVIDTNGATGNVVQGNYIGTQVNGASPLGNSVYGVRIRNSASNNTIGGTAAGAANTIAFNGGDGVGVHSGSGNSTLSNAIFSNGGLGIELGNNWLTPNDPGDIDTGANNLQNFPVLTAATTGSTQIDGTLNSTASTLFQLEFFSNVACDASGNGEGESFLGFSDETTDGSGNTNFVVVFSAEVPVGQFITATATDPGGNTSEFSACVEVIAGPNLVTELDTDGAAGVRASIQQVYDPNTLDPLPGALVGSYQASMTYNGTLLEVLDVRLKAPFDTGNVAIDNMAGVITFDAAAVGGAPWPVNPLAFAVLRLTGCVTDSVTLTPSFNQVLDGGGDPLAVDQPTANTLRRGDAKADGTINIADALFEAQYLTGLRALGENSDSVHAVNAASVKQDGAFDVINIADVLFIAQHLVGLRDGCFNLL